MPNYTEYWVDYSGDKRTGTQVKNTRAWPGDAAKGIAPGPYITGAIRYIDAPNLLKTKHTNKTEYNSLIAAGLKVRLVMQNTTTDADGGYQAGVANAQRAKAGAEYLGYNGVIFFTNDRPSVPNPQVWQAYLDGAASVLGKARVGAYGFRNAIDYAVGHASAFWQSGRESELANHANVYQWNNGRVYIDGLEADLNKVVRDYVPFVPSMEDASMITPQYLDYSAESFYAAFPVESSGNSGIMAAVWFRIGTCWGGSCEYEVNFVNQAGQVVPATAGDTNRGAGGLPSQAGVLDNNQYAYWLLPPDCTMVGLRYKNLTKENRVGISFPQKEK